MYTYIIIFCYLQRQVCLSISPDYLSITTGSHDEWLCHLIWIFVPLFIICNRFPGYFSIGFARIIFLIGVLGKRIPTPLFSSIRPAVEAVQGQKHVPGPTGLSENKCRPIIQTIGMSNRVNRAGGYRVCSRIPRGTSIRCYSILHSPQMIFGIFSRIFQHFADKPLICTVNWNKRAKNFIGTFSVLAGVSGVRAKNSWGSLITAPPRPSLSRIFIQIPQFLKSPVIEACLYDACPHYRQRRLPMTADVTHSSSVFVI